MSAAGQSPSRPPDRAAPHVVADDETGEVSSIAVLARHGLIPDAFEEEIRAG
jgi:hypothetical protein